MSGSPILPDRGRARPGLVPAFVRLGALGLLVIVLAACAGGSSASGVVSLTDPSASPGSSAQASLDPEEAMLAFSECMRKNGVEVYLTGQRGGSGGATTGDPSTPPARIDPEKMAAAEKACSALRPRGGVTGPDGQIDPEFQDRMVKFAQCMREHGVDLPDPKFSSGGGMAIELPTGSGGAPAFDPSSSTFQEAQKACRSLLPGLPGDASGNGSPGAVQP